MKKGGFIKRNAEKAREWLAKRGPIKAKNAKRAKKMRERNFMGDQALRKGDKSDWIKGCPCEVTGLWPVDPAHVQGARGMGGAGGDATGLVPLIRQCHTDFDGNSIPYLTDDQFAAKWGRTRASIAARALYYEELWQRYGADADPNTLSF